MAQLGPQLDLPRCPYCNVDRPSLNAQTGQPFETKDYMGASRRYWKVYICSRCGGVITAAASGDNHPINEIYPPGHDVNTAVPDPARNYLTQALNSLHAPAGASMLAASAVDAMLKTKNYTQGNLYNRINKAAEDHLITMEMAQWAHQVRLDANEPRHADQQKPLPDQQDAKRSIEFAMALAQFMFVLPAMVHKGLEETKETKNN